MTKVRLFVAFVFVTAVLNVVVWMIPDPPSSTGAASLGYAGVLWLWLLLWGSIGVANYLATPPQPVGLSQIAGACGLVAFGALCAVAYGEASVILRYAYGVVVVSQLRFIDVVVGAVTLAAAFVTPVAVVAGVVINLASRRSH
jgi:hypothetical protein